MKISEEKVDKINETFKRKGYKYTEKRKAMVELLVNEDRYINAKYVSYPLFSNNLDTNHKPQIYDHQFDNLSILLFLNYHIHGHELF